MRGRKTLIDAIFQEFLHTLLIKIKGVRLVRNLIDPEHPNVKLAGLIIRSSGYIYIDLSQSEIEKIKTFIHELSHSCFCCAKEKTIQNLEKILWRNFTQKQKLTLSKYIPKKITRPPRSRLVKPTARTSCKNKIR